MRSLVRAMVVTATVLPVAVLAPAHATSQGRMGRVVVVQAVPGDRLDVSVDGHVVRRNAAVGSLLGPFELTSGPHRLQFRDPTGSLRLTAMAEVRGGSSSDVVVHLPAQVGGTPVVNTYRTPRGPIGPGKARVLIAHTATVAPADVRVDGRVVFRDIANGEFASADVAAGTHTVAILPTGQTQHPILGPLKVTLQAGTATMVYAVGSPSNGSMDVITHTLSVAAMTSSTPTAIDTGSAGLVAGQRVSPFSVHPSAVTSAVATSDSSHARRSTVIVAVLVVLALGLGTLGLRRGRHRPPTIPPA